MLNLCRCKKNIAWGRSPLCAPCLVSLQLLVTAQGEPVTDWANLPRDRLYAGRYRYKPVRCGKKDCKSCPHYWYVYRVWRVNGRAQEHYLGPVDDKGEEYQVPTLRRARRAFGH